MILFGTKLRPLLIPDKGKLAKISLVKYDLLSEPVVLRVLSFSPGGNDPNT